MNNPDNNPLIQFVDTPQTMTSIEIAEVTGKQHKNVLQAIRNMEPAWEKVTGLKFQLCMKISELANGVKKENPYYVLTKTETLYIATKFNDEARARLVVRWEQLEHESRQPPFSSVAPPVRRDDAAAVPAASAAGTRPLVIPRPYSRRELILMQLELEEENERLHRTYDRDMFHLACEMVHWWSELCQLRKACGLGEPAAFRQPAQQALPPADCRKTATYTATQIARDYGLSAASLNTLLSEAGIQYQSSGQWLPAPDYANRGFTAVKHVSVTADDGHQQQKPYTVWTETGRQFLHDTLALRGLLPTAESTLPPPAPSQKAEKGRKT